MNQMNLANIYILRQGCSLQHIEPGSGIVGKPDRHGLTLIYYEGNLLDTPALRTYESRIACSARRLFENIPTTALIYVDSEGVAAPLLAIGEAKSGTTVVIDWLPESGTRLTVNGQVKGKDIAGEDFYKALMKIEEPFEYRSRLTMPKYVINATGDQFFLPDSSRFYFDKLKAESHLR